MPITAQQRVLPDPQHHQIQRAIAVDVDRIGTRHLRHLGHLAKIKADRPALRRCVDEEARGVAAPRRIKIGPLIAVTVKHRNATTHEMLPAATVDLRGGQCRTVIDKGRIGQHRRARHTDQPDDAKEYLHAATSLPCVSNPSVSSDSASAAAPCAQSISPQAWVSMRGIGRSVFSVIPCISDRVSLA